METVHLQHKSGGRITSINAIGHSTYMGAAEWFYIGDIEWKDGGKSVGTQIPPWAVCFDHDIQEAHSEYAIVSKAMNDYLLCHGKWHEPVQKRNGLMVSWTPKSKKSQMAISFLANP